MEIIFISLLAACFKTVAKVRIYFELIDNINKKNLPFSLLLKGVNPTYKSIVIKYTKCILH